MLSGALSPINCNDAKKMKKFNNGNKCCGFKKPSYLPTTIGQVKAMKSPIMKKKTIDEIVDEGTTSVTTITMADLDLDQMVSNI